MFRIRSRLAVPICVVAVTLVSGALVTAQTTPMLSAAEPNCAVSTARIGTLDVTQFFGLAGGASGFSQTFGLANTQGGASAESVAQRCMRVDVENPSPGDLVPVGGYVMGGFAFDPNATTGSGIRGVQVFLDDPNQGGAIIGQTNPASVDSAHASGVASQ